MERVLRLLCVSLIVLAATAVAQSPESEFEKLLNQVRQNQESGKSTAGAVVQKSEEGAVVVRTAFAGFKGPFRITVVSMKYRKDESPVRLSAAGIVSEAETSRSQVGTPKLTLPFEKEMNAVEISFRFGDGSEPKLTLPLHEARPSSGMIVSDTK